MLNRRSKTFLIVSASIAIVVGALVGMGIKYAASHYWSGKVSDAQIYKEVKDMFPYMLPDEQPTVATVTDVNKLSEQEFFKHAKNGDSLLAFSKAQVAVLYRHKGRVVVNLGPINTPSQSTNSSSLDQTK